MLTGFSCSGTECPLFSVMGEQHCRRTESTYSIVSLPQNKVSPLRSPRGVVRSQDQINGAAGMRSGRKRMLFRNGADTGCVSSTDNITGRESRQTSLWCFTRENRANRHMRQSR